MMKLLKIMQLKVEIIMIKKQIPHKLFNIIVDFSFSIAVSKHDLITDNR